MRITFQKNHNICYVIDFGFDTPFQSSMYWLTIVKEYHDRFPGAGMQITGAKMVFCFWRRSDHKLYSKFFHKKKSTSF